MDSREMALGTLNQLKRTNCNTLISAMNQYWTGAILKQGPLDWASIVLLAQQVKANARSMVQVCQSQDGYVAWQSIKKRHSGHGSPIESKHQRTCLHGNNDKV